jgi:CARDB
MLTVPDHCLPTRQCCALTAAALILLCVVAACSDKPVGPTDFSPPLLPDYVIGDVKYTTDGPLDDLSVVVFQIRVQNLGNSDVLGTTVSMYVDGRIAMHQPLDGLPSLDAKTVRFNWPAQAGEHEILFGVDRPPLDTTFVEESREDNNTATLALTIPFRERNIVTQEIIAFETLPRGIRNDSLLEQVITLARDSGLQRPRWRSHASDPVRYGGGN